MSDAGPQVRHVAFFDRFYAEVGVLEADGLEERLAATSEHLHPEFAELFDDMLHRPVDRLATQPEDLEALVAAITIYHMVIEGMPASSVSDTRAFALKALERRF